MTTNYFRSTKKLARYSLILLMSFLLSFPITASADPVQENSVANEGKSIHEINQELLEGRELLWTSEKVRVPLVEDSNLQSRDVTSSLIAPKAAITGYVDFYIKVYTGRFVVPFYNMAVTSPSNASLESYQFGVYYSGNYLNGGDESYVDAGAIPMLRRNYTAEGLGNIYLTEGTFSVSMKTGGFMTSLGYGFVIPQSATIPFKFDY